MFMKQLLHDNPIGAEIISELAALGVEPLPECYEAWFHYKSGEIPALARSLDKIRESAGKITKDLLLRLHSVYCKPIHLVELLPDFARNIGEPADEVASIAQNIVEESQKLSSDTARAVVSLSSPNLERIEIVSIVSHLSKKAQESINKNLELEKDLSRAANEIKALKTSLAKVERDAQRDVLTQLYNRRYMDARLKWELIHAHTESLPLCLIVGDIDHFKRFNDTWGHKTGDEALKFVASVLSRNTKGKDAVARYGGEEFLLLLPETNLKEAAALAENIRSILNRNRMVRRSTGQDLGFVTMSFGVAQINPDSSPVSLFEEADAALYHAKRHGRNRVVTEIDVAAPQEILNAREPDLKSELAV